MSDSILGYIPPGFTPWDNQVEALLQIEKDWRYNDVFIVDAPTGAGKTLIEVTIGRWQAAQNKRTALITPTKQQQHQIYETAQTAPSLEGRANYKCSNVSGLSCKRMAEISDGNYCRQCPYTSARDRAKKEPLAVFNYSSYYNLRFQKGTRPTDVLVIDEGHLVVDMIKDLNEIKFSAKDGLEKEFLNDTRGDVALWMEEARNKYQRELIRLTPDNPRYHKLNKLIEKFNNFLFREFLYHIKRVKQEDGSISLVCIPNKAAGMERTPWTGNRQKIVFVSATFSDKNIPILGLTNRRIKRVTVGSPVPPENRPVVYHPVATISARNKYAMLPHLVENMKKIFDAYPTRKGIVHITYEMQRALAKDFTGSRFLFHNKTNKKRVYKLFRKSKEALILFASGMHEGVDLKHDAARFQIIPIISKPYLGDSYNMEILREDPERYLEMTMQKTIQQGGRVCRAPDDYGVTYILDASFMQQVKGQGDTHLPEYFTKALLFSSDKENVLVPPMPESANLTSTEKERDELHNAKTEV